MANAHALGIIHRDIKPSNMMITETGTLKMMDFGIARILGGEHITRSGYLVGTVKYMSPEQVRGEEVDGRSDLYSLGIVLFEMLTGRVPFRAQSDYEILKAHAELPPDLLREHVTNVPQELETTVMRALAKPPEERYQSAREFQNALEHSLDFDRTLLKGQPGVITQPLSTPSEVSRQLLSGMGESRPMPIDTGSISKAPVSEGYTGPSKKSSAVDISLPPPAPGQPTRRLGWVWIGAGLVLILVAVAGGIGLWQKQSTQVSALTATNLSDDLQTRQWLELAHRAFVEGRLSSPPGDNAVDLAGQVLQRSPGHIEALRILVFVANRHIELAGAALARQQPEDAERNLASSRQLIARFGLTGVDGAALDLLSQRIAAVTASSNPSNADARAQTKEPDARNAGRSKPLRSEGKRLREPKNPRRADPLAGRDLRERSSMDTESTTGGLRGAEKTDSSSVRAQQRIQEERLAEEKFVEERGQREARNARERLRIVGQGDVALKQWEAQKRQEEQQAERQYQEEKARRDAKWQD